MIDPNLGKEEKRNKLKIAIAKQTKVTKENIFGEGVDVPLLGKYSQFSLNVNSTTSVRFDKKNIGRNPIVDCERKRKRK